MYTISFQSSTSEVSIYLQTLPFFHFIKFSNPLIVMELYVFGFLNLKLFDKLWFERVYFEQWPYKFTSIFRFFFYEDKDFGYLGFGYLIYLFFHLDIGRLLNNFSESRSYGWTWWFRFIWEEIKWGYEWYPNLQCWEYAEKFESCVLQVCFHTSQFIHVEQRKVVRGHIRELDWELPIDETFCCIIHYDVQPLWILLFQFS